MFQLNIVDNENIAIFLDLIPWMFIIIHIEEVPYEMKISRTVLERRFFEPNDDHNGCRLNRNEIMQKLYRIIMRLCDWKLIPMIEVIYFIT